MGLKISRNIAHHHFKQLKNNKTFIRDLSILSVVLHGKGNRIQKPKLSPRNEVLLEQRIILKQSSTEKIRNIIDAVNLTCITRGPARGCV